MTNLSRKDTLKKVLLSLAFVILSLTAVFVYASAWPYPPADTLDPACNPGDVDCNVNPLWIKNKTDNFLTNIIDNVGIGTNTPSARLHIDGDISSSPSVSNPTKTVDVSGFDKLLTSGTYTGSTSSTWSVIVSDATGDPEYFDYDINNDGSLEGVHIPMTGGNQLIQDGVEVNFTTTTGYSVGDKWEFNVVPASGSDVDPLLVSADGNELLNVSTDRISFFGKYFFPTSDGIADQVLTTDGGGNLSWQTPTTGGGGGTNYTFENGLVESAGTVALGGSLNSTTNIFTNGRAFYLGTNLGDLGSVTLNGYSTTIGADFKLNIRTPKVVSGAAVNGQVLRLLDNATGEVEFANIASGNDQLYKENPSSPTTPTALGSNAVAIGSGASSSSTHAIALGNFTTASGIRSLATGYFTTASGDQSASFNSLSLASGQYSSAFNSGTIASGKASAAFGTSTTTPSFSEFALGMYPTTYIPAGGTSGIDNGDRLFNIGNGANGGSPSDAFTILKSGMIGIGYDNFESSMASSAEFQVNGSIQQANATNCPLEADSVGNIGCAPSDQKLKTNIETSNYGLDEILALKPVTYNFIDAQKFGDAQKIGFIAQDLEKVIPEVVTEGPEYKSVNYGLITPVLTKAVQELNTKVDLLSASSGFSTDTLVTTISELISKAISNLQDITVQSINSVSGVFEKVTTNLLSSKKVETSELCVDDVCVTRDQFKQLVEQLGTSNPIIPDPITPENVVTDPLVDEKPIDIINGEQQSTSEITPTPDPVPETVSE